MGSNRTGHTSGLSATELTVEKSAVAADFRTQYHFHHCHFLRDEWGWRYHNDNVCATVNVMLVMVVYVVTGEFTGRDISMKLYAVRVCIYECKQTVPKLGG